jgi:hypothetical protein
MSFKHTVPVYNPNAQKGEKGDPGTPGTPGADGAPGVDGTNGTNGAGYGGTSTTSLSVGTGSKSFTTQAGLAYVPGSRARAASNAAPATNWMEGVVSSYSGTTLVLAVDLIGGSGTHADWNLSIAGQPANAPSGVTVLGEVVRGSDGADLDITLSESIGAGDMILIQFQFKTPSGPQSADLFFNGETSATGYYINGNPDTASLFTSLAATSIRSGFVQIAPTANDGNLTVDGQGVLWGAGSVYTFRVLSGDAINQITLKGQFSAGSSMRIIRL